VPVCLRFVFALLAVWLSVCLVACLCLCLSLSRAVCLLAVCCSLRLLLSVVSAKSRVSWLAFLSVRFQLLRTPHPPHAEALRTPLPSPRLPPAARCCPVNKVARCVPHEVRSHHLSYPPHPHPQISTKPTHHTRKEIWLCTPTPTQPHKVGHCGSGYAHQSIQPAPPPAERVDPRKRAPPTTHNPNYPHDTLKSNISAAATQASSRTPADRAKQQPAPPTRHLTTHPAILFGGVIAPSLRLDVFADIKFAHARELGSEQP
jgi:hypothetical protein